ncbi:MAG: membrane or secreted protein [Flavobacteriales bacterium]
MEVVILSIVLLGLGFAGIAIKILVKKDGEFSGTCASNSPFLNKDGENCSFCGATPDEQCKKEEVEPIEA